MHTYKKTSRGKRGFTLVEMIVAVALFSIVMLVCIGALLALVGANRKAHALQSVMNNLNVALDGMVRSIRMGNSYHCGSGAIAEVQDCPNGGTDFAFEAFGGDQNDGGDQWVYSYDPVTKRIYRSEDANAHTFALTAPEVSIDSMSFYTVGTARGDTMQPKVVISIKGTAGAEDIKTRTSFTLQATAVQRSLDI